MKYKTTISGRTFLFLLFSSAMLIYVIVRAYTLSFTHDESLSFTIVDGSGTWLNTANNHILNTILMSVCKTLFGNSEFALRLPNVLSFILYLIGCFYIFRSSKNNWLLLLGMSLVVLNPFLIEFFSLARGYGLSLAFMLISIYFLIRSESCCLTSSTFLKDFALTSLFASLAIYSNLAMINFFVSALVVISIKFWFFRKNHTTNSSFNIKFLSIIFVSCIPLFLGFKRLLKLKEAGQLYFGDSGFMEGLDSLIKSSIYIEEYASWVILTVKITFIAFFLVGVLFITLNKKYDGVLFLITMLIIFLITGLFLENFIFGANYPTERTALFYVPIIAIFIYLLFQSLIKQYKIKKQYYIPIILCLITPLLVNFVLGANFAYTRTWRYDAHTKDMMKILRDKTQNIGDSASFSNHWLFEPTINYYINIWKLDLNSASRNGVDLNSDFIYRLDDNTKLDNFMILKEYNDINSNLLMRKEPDKK